MERAISRFRSVRPWRMILVLSGNDAYREIVCALPDPSSAIRRLFGPADVAGQDPRDLCIIVGPGFSDVLAEGGDRFYRMLQFTVERGAVVRWWFPGRPPSEWNDASPLFAPVRPWPVVGSLGCLPPGVSTQYIDGRFIFWGADGRLLLFAEAAHVLVLSDARYWPIVALSVSPFPRVPFNRLMRAEQLAGLDLSRLYVIVAPGFTEALTDELVRLLCYAAERGAELRWWAPGVPPSEWRDARWIFASSVDLSVTPESPPRPWSAIPIRRGIRTAAGPDQMPRGEVLPPSDHGIEGAIPLPPAEAPDPAAAAAEAAEGLSEDELTRRFAEQNRRINDLLMRGKG